MPHFQVKEHETYPFTNFGIFRRGARLLVLLIPNDKVYSHQGRGMIGEILDNKQATAFLQMIQLMAYICADMPVFRFKDGGRTFVSFLVFFEAIYDRSRTEIAAWRIFLVDQVVDERGESLDHEKVDRDDDRKTESDQAGGSDDEKEDERKMEVDAPEEEEKKRAPDERKQAAPSKPAPHTKRIINFGTVTYNIVYNAEKAAHVDRFRGGKAKPLEAADELLFRRLNFSTYGMIVDAYTLKNHVGKTNEDGLRNLARDSNVVNPERIFSLRRSCKLLRTYVNEEHSRFKNRIDERYMTPSAYMRDGKLRFPFQDVWWIKPEDMKPHQLQRMYFPITKAPIYDEDSREQVSAIVASALVSKRNQRDDDYIAELDENDSDEDDNGEYDSLGDRQKATADYLARVYEIIGRPLNQSEGAHIGFIHRRKNEYARNIRPLWKAFCFAQTEDQRRDAFTQYRDVYKKFQFDGLQELGELFAYSGDIPDSLRAINKWMVNHLMKKSKHRNFFFYNAYTFKNMSVFANNTINFSESMEAAFCLENLHHKAYLFWNALNDVYRFARDHPHILHIGDHATGKGYLMVNVMKRLQIEGTCRVIDSASAQSVHSNSYRKSYCREYCEEKDPTELGVGSKPGQNSSNMTEAANLKGRLTSNYLSRAVTVINKDDGTRDVQTLVTEANIMQYMGSNLRPRQIDDPMLSRFIVAFEKTTRISERRRNMSTLISAANQGSEFDSYIELTCMTRRIIEAIVAQLCVAIDAEVLPPPDLSIFDNTSGQIFHQASERNIPNINEIRTAGRLRTILRSMVLQNAVFTYLTSPLHSKEVMEEPWSVQHLARIMPYAIATVEMVLFAYGCFCDAYRNPLRSELLRFIEEKILPVDRNACRTRDEIKAYRGANYRAFWRPTPNDAPQLNEDYYVIYQDTVKRHADSERQRMRGDHDPPAQVLPSVRPSVGGSKPNTWATLCDFANVIASDNDFSFTDAKATLKELLKEKITKIEVLPDGKERQYDIPLLRVRGEDTGEIWIERSIIDNPHNDTIVDIAWLNLRFLVPKEGRYLEGTSDRGFPYIYNVVDVKPEGDKKALLIQNNDKINPGIKMNMELNARGNGFHAKRRRAENGDAVFGSQEGRDPDQDNFMSVVMSREYEDISGGEERARRDRYRKKNKFFGPMFNGRSEVRSARRMCYRLGLDIDDQQKLVPSIEPSRQMEEIIANEQKELPDYDAECMRGTLLSLEEQKEVSRIYPDGYVEIIKLHQLEKSGKTNSHPMAVTLNETTDEYETLSASRDNASSRDAFSFAGMGVGAPSAMQIDEAMPFRRSTLFEDESTRGALDTIPEVDEEPVDNHFSLRSPIRSQAKDLQEQLRKDRAEGVSRSTFGGFQTPGSANKKPLLLAKHRNPFGVLGIPLQHANRGEPSSSPSVNRVQHETSDNTSSASDQRPMNQTEQEIVNLFRSVRVSKPK
jgi:hypothetical protein